MALPLPCPICDKLPKIDISGDNLLVHCPNYCNVINTITPIAQRKDAIMTIHKQHDTTPGYVYEKWNEAIR